MKIFTCLLQITTSMGVFYAFYHVFLRKMTFFSWNRIYLLATLLVSLSMPFIHIELQQQWAVLPPATYAGNILSGDQFGDDFKNSGDVIIREIKAVPEKFDFNWAALLVLAYASISLVLLARLLLITGLLLGKTFLAPKQNGLRVTRSFWKFSNCSFFNLLIVDADTLSPEELELVLQHEKEHMRRYHSIDKTLIEALRAVMWFNPFLYLYKNAISQVQEFEVDHAMAKNFDKQAYGRLLLKLSVCSSHFLVNNFSKSPLRTRIQMLFTKQSNKMKKMAYMFMLPIFAGMFWCFSVEMVYASLNESSTGKKVPGPKKATENTFKKAAVRIVQDKLAQIEEARLAIDNEIGKADLLTFLTVQHDIESTALKVPVIMPEEAAAGKFRVVLDPGHGGKDNMARAGMVLEKDMTLAICQEIKQVLEQKGYEVLLTRNADVTMSLADRAAIKGDIFISVHTNTWVKVGAGREAKLLGNGIDIYTSKYTKADSVLAPSRNVLADAFKQELAGLKGIRFNAVKNQYLAVLRENTVPAILIELGYLTNKNDYAFIRSKDNQQQIGLAFADAIEAYRARK